MIGKALYSETLQEFVIYKHIIGKRRGEPYYWARPLEMFMEKVEVNGKKMLRFRYIEK